MGLSGRLILFITTEIPYFVLILCNFENKVICVLLNATNSLKIILGSAFHVRSKLIVYWLKRIVLEPFWCWCGWWFLSILFIYFSSKNVSNNWFLYRMDNDQICSTSELIFLIQFYALLKHPVGHVSRFSFHPKSHFK